MSCRIIIKKNIKKYVIPWMSGFFVLFSLSSSLLSLDIISWLPFVSLRTQVSKL